MLNCPAKIHYTQIFSKITLMPPTEEIASDLRTAYGPELQHSIFFDTLTMHMTMSPVGLSKASLSMLVAHRLFGPTSVNAVLPPAHGVQKSLLCVLLY
jgi:hypothetical protein